MSTTKTPWQNWVLVPMTMTVIALGGFMCAEVSTKSEVEALRREVASVKADVRLIEELYNDRNVPR